MRSLRNKDSLKLDVVSSNTILKSYAENRTVVDFEDVQDLYRVMTDFIKMKMNDSETTVIKIPYLGMLYRRFDLDNLVLCETAKEEQMYDEMLVKYLFTPVPKGYRVHKNLKNNFYKPPAKKKMYYRDEILENDSYQKIIDEENLENNKLAPEED